jgi:hypothetical protein
MLVSLKGTIGDQPTFGTDLDQLPAEFSRLTDEPAGGHSS